MRADNMRLVKAVLVAGLYPNIARVDGGGGKGADGVSKKPKLITRTADGKSGKQLPSLAIYHRRGCMLSNRCRQLWLGGDAKQR